MSQERRKRQQSRQGDADNSGKTRKAILYIAILAFFAGAYFAGWHYKNHKYDSFAKCLASKNAKMYGAYWCPHCADQKRKFSGAFKYVPYVECASEDDPYHKLTAACQAAGVREFPSWQFGTDPPKADVFSLEALSQKTGCSLP